MMRYEEFSRKDPTIKQLHIYPEEQVNSPYELYIYTPDQPPPPSGFPVVYVLDGNALFQTVQHAISLQSRRTDATGVPAAVVVGIGYPGDQPFNLKRRFYDYTPPATSTTLPPRPDGRPWPENGAAEQFLSFLREEIQPFLVEHYQINPKQQTIFGHSLGGLFALYTLFTKPDTFQGYIATSPSIWWNERNVLDYVPSFLANLENNKEAIRLFLSVGSLEKDHLIIDAKALTARLESYNSNRFEVRYIEGENENHMSIVPTVISKGLRFTLQNFIDIEGRTDR
ncbi:alpha/beta hydrolase [Aquibacillus kalidii]|uniref:alpha/beta hydrolase n=1 Tax=Aquibacillus kalidii TaxID=2762597 RepID=UPI0016456D99|nr:alpha/beta hydrolase-fold protein [Aquibacillus kalidii]